MQASMPPRTSPCPEQPGAADHVAALARPEITAIERRRAVGHEQQELGNTEPHAPAPPRHRATAGIDLEALRDRFAVDENEVPARANPIAWHRGEDRKSTRLNSSH